MAEDGPQDRAMALWPQVEVVPGAHATLAALGAHWPLHIATNASVSTRPLIAGALQRAGLLQHFQHIFCFTEIGARKDQAAFWQTVQATTGVPLHATAMVGDSLEQDVLGPARFGVRTVWFNAGGARPAPTPPVDQVRALAELPAYFLALSSTTRPSSTPTSLSP